jgi:hypothetical protein
VPIDLSSAISATRAGLEDHAARMVAVLTDADAIGQRLAGDAEGQLRDARELPLVRYRHGALTISLDGTIDVGPGLGARLAEPYAQVGTAARQELLLPQLAKDLGEPFGALAAASDRNAAPGAELFDLRARRGSDLFGAVLLGLETVIASRGLLRVTLRNARALGTDVGAALARTLPTTPAAAPESTAAGDGAAASPASLGMLDLAGAPPALAGVALALVGLPFVLDAIVAAGLRAARERLTAKLLEAELAARGVRDRLLGWLGAGLGLGPQIGAYVSEVGAKLEAAFRETLVGGLALLPALLDWLHEAVHNYAAAIGDKLQATRASIEGIEATDLKFSTVGQLLRDMADGRSVAADAYARAVSPEPKKGEQLNPHDQAVRDAFKALESVSHPEAWLGAGADPPPRPSFPAIDEILLDAARVRILDAAGMSFGTGAVAALDELLSGAAGVLGVTAGTLRAAAHRGATLGEPDVWARIGAETRGVADTFAGLRSHARERVVDVDEGAVAFGDRIAAAGVALVAVAIPAWVGEVDLRVQRGAHRPTSPHILDRSGRLGRVRVPRVTIRADAGQAADAVAGRFRGAVRDAYRAGAATWERLR